MFLALLLIVTVLFLFVILKKWHQQCRYWPEKGVKSLQPLPIFGNMLPSLTGQTSLCDLIENLYNQFHNERYFGIFQLFTPTLVLKDPELIRSITVKNFDHFVDHTGLVTTDVDTMWDKGLFASTGMHWRHLRQTISPVFTSRKMRMIYVLMDNCGRDFVNYFHNQQSDTIDVDLKEIFMYYTNDVIASTAFGIECNSLKDKNNEFLIHGRELADFTGLKRLLFIVHPNLPTLARLLQWKIVSRKVGDFFTQIIKETIKMREEHNIVRQDLIHLLLQARKGQLRDNEEESTTLATDETILTDEDIVAQAVNFFLGGFDTIANQLSFLFYELGVNPEIQQRLRNEIQSTLDKNNGKITYETLAGMKYLDMVVNEATRKWPQALFLDRVCTKPFIIEPESPDEQPIPINIGDVLWLPVYGLHRDPEYFPNPERFDPERFNDENRDRIKLFTFLPFGSGPRNCIASRFALLEMKTIVCHLLVKFEIVPNERTQIPLKITKKNVMLLPEGGFHMRLKKLAN